MKGGSCGTEMLSARKQKKEKGDSYQPRHAKLGKDKTLALSFRSLDVEVSRNKIQVSFQAMNHSPWFVSRLLSSTL